MSKIKIKVKLTKKSRLPQTDIYNVAFGRTFSDHLFSADYKNGKWTNLQIMPIDKMKMHPSNMALHYGQSIFEGMKASKLNDGTPALFRPELNARRLNLSAERMSMPPVPEDIFLEGLKKLLEIDADWIPSGEGQSLYIRPFMFATDEYLGVQPSQTYKFMIITSPAGSYYSKPVSLIAEQTYIRAAVGGTGEAKCAGNYAASLLPARIAREKGYDQVMWMDAKEFKYIQEVGTMNLFFVIDGQVITPMTDGAILKGTTRASFIQILKDKNIPVIEKLLSIDEVLAAHKAGKLQEVFGAGTAVVVSPVAEISYKDEKLVLPDPKTFKIANMLKATIDGLRNGTVEDVHGWVVTLHKEELVNA